MSLAALSPSPHRPGAAMATFRAKLTADQERLHAFHLRLACSYREAARRHPEYSRDLRTGMRRHALQSRRPGDSSI